VATFSTPVELFSERCRLRPPSEADVPHVFSATRFAGFNDGMAWDPPEDEAELHARLQYNLRAWSKSEAFNFSVERRNDGAFLGRVTVRVDGRSGSKAWELGYWIHPRSQGQGYATEAARRVIDFAFVELDARVVAASAATFNVKSQRVLEKLGLKRVAYLPQGFLKQGEWIAEYRYSVARSAWQP
jgi:ribosomal-protein-alanine N-acetyltransferase